MKRQSMLPIICTLSVLAAALAPGNVSHTALLPAPQLVSPANNATIITPTFQWRSVVNAHHYHIQVADNNLFSTPAFDEETFDLTITPVSTLQNGDLWWRVRTVDANNNPGPWSAVRKLTKHIPAPVLSSPANGASNIVTPRLQWQAAEGAAIYSVQIATDQAFTNRVFEDTIHDLALTPISSLPNGLLWWRVQGLDADDHAGAWSAAWSFTKHIPGPALNTPANGATVVNPKLEWKNADGAADYLLQVASDAGFTNIEFEDSTRNLSLTPIDNLPNGTLWWRVTGRDADGNPGTASNARSFTKHIPAPVLTSPINAAGVVTPTLAWQPANGAAYYLVEVASDSGFTSDLQQYRTYNTDVTPIVALDPGTWYWRVRGVDADDHEGSNSAVRSFTLASIPNCANTVLALISPANGATLTNDPQFEWSCLQDADSYRVRVYSGSDLYDSAPSTDYTVYTPYLAPNYDERTYNNGTYTWKVEAFDGNTLIGTSGTRTFTKNATLALTGPNDGAALGNDPTFRWEAVRGAEAYKVLVYDQDSNLYDYTWTKHTSYTPYPHPNVDEDIYNNGTYTWKVEAYQREWAPGLITTSGTRSFIKNAAFDLLAPANGSSIQADPTLKWEAVRGSMGYKVLVYDQGSNLYDYTWTEYTSYTPYAHPNFDEQTYNNGSYTWKVEAYQDTFQDSSGLISTSSQTRTFTRASQLNLQDPANGAVINGDPTFQWGAVRGAEAYLVKVYKGTALYDQAWVGYTTYTPYAHPNFDEDQYAEGKYTWEVLAYQSGYAGTGALITTSARRTFTISFSAKLFLPVVYNNQ